MSSEVASVYCSSNIRGLVKFKGLVGPRSNPTGLISSHPLRILFMHTVFFFVLEGGILYLQAFATYRIMSRKVFAHRLVSVTRFLFENRKKTFFPCFTMLSVSEKKKRRSESLGDDSSDNVSVTDEENKMETPTVEADALLEQVSTLPWCNRREKTSSIFLNAIPCTCSSFC